MQDPRIEDALGAPIKGYGEETTRRRRTHVSHAVYEKDGIKYMRMRFYIKGIRNKAIVEVDMKQVNIFINFLVARFSYSIFILRCFIIPEFLWKL